MNRKPRAIDLFCGCGGLTLGLKQAGFEVIGAVEIDSLAAETYRMNHAEVHVWEQDIQTLGGESILKQFKLKKGELDLLAGCPPCQGFSTMRTLNGGRKIKDERNDLIFDFLRLVKELEPKAIMMENVPGLIEDKRLKEFCSEIEGLGYKVNCDVKNAADYGVPQRRRRMILLAGKGFEIGFAKPVKKKKTVADAIGRMPKAGQSGDHLHDWQERRTEEVIDRISKIPKNGGSRTDLPKEVQLDCHKKCNGFKDVYGRMAWDKPAPTITSGCTNPSKGRFIHPEENRAITLREAAVLQTFPRGYKFPTCKSKGDISLMIGNALPPVLIKKHSRGIYYQLKNGA